MPEKQLFKNGGSSSHSFSSKLRKPDVVRSDKMHLKSNGKRNILEDLCAVDNSPSNVKRPKVVAARGFSKRCGPFPSQNHCGGSDLYTAKSAAAIPAVPLRCVPMLNAQLDSESPIAEQGEHDGDGLKLSNVNENTVDLGKDTWKSDLEKLTALIAQAKEYIHTYNTKYSTIKEGSSRVSEVFEPKPLMETSRQDERTADQILADSVTRWNSDESLSEIMMNVDERMENEGKKPSRLGNEMEDDEEVSVLSPEECSTLQQHSKHRCDDDIVSTRKNETNVLLWSTHKPVLDGNSRVESQVIEIIECEPTETDFVETPLEASFLNLDECSLGEEQEGEVLTNIPGDMVERMAKSSDGHMHAVNPKELINLSIVPHDHPQAIMTRTILMMFEVQYAEVLKEPREQRVGKGTYPHLVVAARLKEKGMCLSAEKPFGHIPGVQIGHEFRFRAELAVVGLHSQLMAGIDYVVLDGNKIATSVINSGCYENEAKALDVLIYSGQGGNQKTARKAVDQRLEKGNLALKNSMDMRYPVRVTYKRKTLLASNASGLSNERDVIYVYDGLYSVNRMLQERDQYGKLVFKFELHRMPGQPRPHQTYVVPIKQVKCNEVCLVDDISQGQENVPLRAMNGLDDDMYPSFTYTTNTVYPAWYQRIEPIGCNCTNGCSDSQQCPCVLKNGGEIPFNEKGEIIRARPIVHECGPSCKCPPSCMNRVSQCGPRYQLEIFKTMTTGWGVRSRNYISSGSFICEYVGELLQDKEAEQRINNDEYLFDLSGDDGEEGDDGEFQSFNGSKSNDDCFAIDAAKFGNIGRFINHSCSPNLFAQKVLYDHDDKRVPHIMFFATRNIPPLQELSYDYNYKMDRVCDLNGNVKTKACYCGSRKCTRRMY